MIRLPPALVLFVALVLSVSFAVFAQDVPETAYDESESLPCESVPVVSATLIETSTGSPTPPPRVSRFRLESRSRIAMLHLAKREGRADSNSDLLITLDHLLRC